MLLVEVEGVGLLAREEGRREDDEEGCDQVILVLHLEEVYLVVEGNY